MYRYWYYIIPYSHHSMYNTHITSIATSVNCGQPLSPPTSGHILPYTNTLEGAIVTYMCWNIHKEENVSQCIEVSTMAVCNEHGNWELISQDSCSIFSGLFC